MTERAPLTETHVRALLAAAMAYDNRRPGQANIEAWLEAGTGARWTFEEALQAVHEHYRDSTEFLMPGHITRIVRARRQTPAQPPRLRLEAAKPADPERTGRIMAALAARLGWRRAEPHPATEVDCPHCHSRAGRPCQRQRTRGPHRGEWQPLAQPHDSRVQAAARLIDETTED